MLELTYKPGEGNTHTQRHSYKQKSTKKFSCDSGLLATYLTLYNHLNGIVIVDVAQVLLTVFFYCQ